MVGHEHLSAKTVATVEQFRMALPLFSVYLGLDITLADQLPNTTFWSYPSYDIEAFYQSVYDGEVPDALPVFLTSASVKDPGNAHAASPGHSTVEVMAIVPPDRRFWHVDGDRNAVLRHTRSPEYLAAKQRLTRAVIDRAAELIPGLREHIVFCEASTPITQERFALSTGGACYGLELSIDQSGHRRPAPRTEIPGLYLAGASTFYNHGVGGVIVGGLGTAAAILGRDLAQEVRSGRVLADPAKLTDFGPAWDPWQHSKPRAGRERRPAGVSAGAASA